MKANFTKAVRELDREDEFYGKVIITYQINLFRKLVLNMENESVEFWLRGPLPDITSVLQPAAHALLQVQMEIHRLMKDFPVSLLWEKRAGNASPAFHLQHIAGVLGRLFTYANEEELSPEQLRYLSDEGKMNGEITVDILLRNLDDQIETSINYLKKIKPETLTQVRFVGRKKIPSTQIGLLFHAAEHTMRHTGQLLVTVKVILTRNEN